MSEIARAAAAPTIARIPGSRVGSADITIPMIRSFPLDQAGEALAAVATQHVRGKVVAIGYSLRYGYPGLTTTMPVVLEFFRGQEPIGRTRTFLVYDFRNVP